MLRDKWGFKGYVVSDMGALDNLIHPQGYARTPAEAAVQGVKAGVNLELSGNNPTIYMAIGRVLFFISIYTFFAGSVVEPFLKQALL